MNCRICNSKENDIESHIKKCINNINILNESMESFLIKINAVTVLGTYCIYILVPFSMFLSDLNDFLLDFWFNDNEFCITIFDIKNKKYICQSDEDDEYKTQDSGDTIDLESNDSSDNSCEYESSKSENNIKEDPLLYSSMDEYRLVDLLKINDDFIYRYQEMNVEIKILDKVFTEDSLIQILSQNDDIKISCLCGNITICNCYHCQAFYCNICKGNECIGHEPQLYKIFNTPKYFSNIN
jgi:hypothetical protein